MKRLTGLLSGDYTRQLIVVLLVFGIVARLFAASLGFTYDMESYEQVGRLVAAGENVYEATTRYNYGPFWLLVLGGLYKLASVFPDPFIIFRFTIPLLLSLVDLGIFFFLRRFFGLAAAFIFYFNPLTVTLTGYNSQFDNIAILLALVAAALYGKYEKQALILLGASLVVKHIFFAFPLWLAFRQRRWRDRLLVLLVPLGIFGLSFLPFIKTGATGIINNVLFYVSFKNAPLWHFFILNRFPRVFNEYILFGGALILGAYLCRKKPVVDSLLFYMMILVVFSVAIADQYFSIVLPFIAVYPNVFFFLFTMLQMLYMWVVISAGEVYASVLGRTLDRSAIGYQWQMFFLFAGFMYVIFRKRLQKWTMKRWIGLLAALNMAFLFFIVVPNYTEDKQIVVIEQAIKRADYEVANELYGIIEKRAPLAGSRFWNKLTRVRYHIEYYRNYRKAKDMLEFKE